MTIPKINPEIFVAGTDTGVGKTLVSGLLLRYLRQQGTNCGYQKWVATGDLETAGDLRRVCDLAGIKADENPDSMRVDYLFRLAASPHLAAEVEGKRIDAARLLQSTRELATNLECLIVEGAGGLMVPLDRDTLLIDLIEKLSAPVLLVARSGLGTINHSLLSLAALRERGIGCAGIVFCDEGPELDERIVADNLKTIAETGKVCCAGRLRWSRTDEGLVRQFEPVGKKITAAFTPGK